MLLKIASDYPANVSELKPVTVHLNFIAYTFYLLDGGLLIADTRCTYCNHNRELQLWPLVHNWTNNALLYSNFTETSRCIEHKGIFIEVSTGQTSVGVSPSSSRII